MLALFSFLLLVASAHASDTLAAATTLTFPFAHTGDNLVFSNFYGISIELSAVNIYVGENTSSIPTPFINYLSSIEVRSERPVRFRVGGNSMDDSIYDPNQSNMIIITDPTANDNDLPVTFGPVLFDVLQSIADQLGVQYLIGLSLIMPNSSNQTLLVETMEQKLGSSLDAMLLGNEPDLYADHGKRDSTYNQTDYFSDFDEVTVSLNSSTAGNLLSQPLLGGPSICCDWDLDQLIQLGYLSEFGDDLRYINLQHYPQNNCNGTPSFGLDYYINHTNVVTLAQWQAPGVNDAHQANKQVLLGEFNTASCGGVPNISDTFAATLWQIDYVLQLASVGYSGAYIHTRESGVTYNLFDPGNGTNTNWTTLPSFYSLLPVAELLHGAKGAYVLDMNLTNTTNANVAGYTIYDSSGAPAALALFNYADQGSQAASFLVPQISSTGPDRQVFVRTLTAPSLSEKSQISWGENSFDGVGDGVLVSAKGTPDHQVSCDAGCTVQVPSPGFAIVWVNINDVVKVPDQTQTGSGGGGSGNPSSGHHNGAHSLYAQTSILWLGCAVGLFLLL